MAYKKTPIPPYGTTALNLEKCRPFDPEETKRSCPVPECVMGRISRVEDDGSRYATFMSDCTVCGGTGMVSPRDWQEWRVKNV